jgi:dUTP pyrophosphatase
MIISLKEEKYMDIKQKSMEDLQKQLEGFAKVKQEEAVKEHVAKLQILQDKAYRIEVEVLDGGKLPTKAHLTDAGFDVFATSDVLIYPGQIIKHPLNIKMALPANSWARIETKSGLGSKGMLVFAGVVDEGYRNIPHVIATNLATTTDDENGNMTFNQTPIMIKKGEKIAQITMEPHSTSFFMVQVDRVDINTSRGEGGFGSSGA